MWIYLDIGYQHIDCDAYPSEEGAVIIIGGQSRKGTSDEGVYYSEPFKLEPTETPVGSSKPVQAFDKNMQPW